MKAYSEDLRRKIVEATERGTFKTRAARLFGVRISPAKRYARWRSRPSAIWLLAKLWVHKNRTLAFSAIGVVYVFHDGAGLKRG